MVLTQNRPMLSVQQWDKHHDPDSQIVSFTSESDLPEATYRTVDSAYTIDDTFHGRLQTAIIAKREGKPVVMPNGGGGDGKTGHKNYPFLFAGDPIPSWNGGEAGLDTQMTEATGITTFSSAFAHIGGDTVNPASSDEDEEDTDGPPTPRSRHDQRFSIPSAPTPINTLQPVVSVSTTPASSGDGDSEATHGRHDFPRGEYSVTSGGSVLLRSIPDSSSSSTPPDTRPPYRYSKDSNASSTAPSTRSNTRLLPNPSLHGSYRTDGSAEGGRRGSSEIPFSTKAMPGPMITSATRAISSPKVDFASHSSSSGNAPQYPFAYPNTAGPNDSTPSYGQSIPQSSLGQYSGGSGLGNKPLLDTDRVTDYEIRYADSHEGLQSSNDQGENDRIRLEQLGYSQVFGRDYGFWASFSISFVNLGLLQGPILGVVTTFVYGGPIMVLTMWPIAGFAVCLLTLSMGELASAYPVAGAMASWAWKCARGGIGGERGWAWVVAGITIGYHVSIMCLVPWQIAGLIEHSILMNVPTYETHAWHNELYCMIILPVIGVVASVKWGRSPKLWIAAAIGTAVLWLIITIAMFAKGSKAQSMKQLYTTPYSNLSGWDSSALVYLLGWVSACIATGQDVSAHMAEETRNPSRNVPMAMFTSVFTVYVGGYILIIALLLSVSPEDLPSVFAAPFPAGEILVNALGIKAALAILAFIMFADLVQGLAQIQASSRFVFAMARDQALPFSRIFSQTNSQKLPVHATWLILGLTWAICLCLWPSPSVAPSVLSVSGGTFCLLAYIIPIVLYLFSRINLGFENRSAFSLQKFSKPVAIVGVTAATLFTVLLAVPPGRPVSPQTMSWSPVTLAGALIFSAVTWKLYGDKHFSGPVKAITKWTAGVEIDLQDALKRPQAQVAPPRATAGTQNSAKVGQGPYAPTPSNPLPQTANTNVVSGDSFGNMGSKQFGSGRSGGYNSFGNK